MKCNRTSHNNKNVRFVLTVTNNWISMGTTVFLLSVLNWSECTETSLITYVLFLTCCFPFLGELLHIYMQIHKVVSDRSGTAQQKAIYFSWCNTKRCKVFSTKVCQLFKALVCPNWLLTVHWHSDMPVCAGSFQLEAQCQNFGFTEISDTSMLAYVFATHLIRIKFKNSS